MPHEVLTSEEFHAALERLYERLMRIGWIEQTGSHEDKTAIAISPLGHNRLSILPASHPCRLSRTIFSGHLRRLDAVGMRFERSLTGDGSVMFLMGDTG